MIRTVILIPDNPAAGNLYGLPFSPTFSGLGESFRGFGLLNGGLTALPAFALDHFPGDEEEVIESTNDYRNHFRFRFRNFEEDFMNTVFTVIRGDNATFRCQVREDGVAVDISGWQFTMTAKWEYTDPNSAAVFTRTNGSGITITDAPNGEFTIDLVPSNTAGLPPSRSVLHFDVQAVTPSPANKNLTVLYGKLVVLPDVTV